MRVFSRLSSLFPCSVGSLETEKRAQTLLTLLSRSQFPRKSLSLRPTRNLPSFCSFPQQPPCPDPPTKSPSGGPDAAALFVIRLFLTVNQPGKPNPVSCVERATTEIAARRARARLVSALDSPLLTDPVVLGFPVAFSDSIDSPNGHTESSSTQDASLDISLNPFYRTSLAQPSASFMTGSIHSAPPPKDELR